MLKKVGSTVLGALFVVGGMAYAAEEAAPAAPKEKPVVAEVIEPEIPEVVARIGKEDIGKEEYNRQVEGILQSQGGGRFPGQLPPKPTSEVYQIAMKSLIEQKVVTQLAAKAKITIEDSEVNEILDGIRKNFKTEEEFSAVLEREGLTLEELTTRIRETKIAEKFLTDKLDEMTKDVDTSDKVLKARYEELKEAGQLNRPESADVSHILIKVEGQDEKSWADAKVKIDAARKRIVEGKEDFLVVAKEVTEDQPGFDRSGGVYANTPKGQMVPEFEQRMFSMPINEVSEPFKTQFGWHILTVPKRSEAGVVPFEEVKEGIIGEAEGLARQKAYTDYMEVAKKEVKIQVFFEDAKEPKEVKDPA